jgi:phage N-6-adenine-methyltransferase
MSEPRQKPGRSKQDYGTPPTLLAAVKARLGISRFDCDLAASRENTVAPICITANTDALLLKSWAFGLGWNWINPPFARIAPWVEKAHWQGVQRGVKTAVLIPAGVGSKWWREWVHNRAQVLFLSPRVTFVGCTDPYPKDCALLLYGNGYEGEYECWNWRESAPERNADAAPVALPGDVGRASSSSSSSVKGEMS